jgi:hypothetical protein
VSASGALGLEGQSVEGEVIMNLWLENKIGVVRRYRLVKSEATVISAVSSSLVRLVTPINSTLAPAM